jgi:cytochrome b subunit of formate dehydrogenase
MEILRTAQNPWGQDVLVGIGWGLVWLAVVASVVFVAGHTAWMMMKGTKAHEPAPGPGGAGLPERIPRHSVAARAFHWSMSTAMLVLLVTAFVPVLGLQFPWVTIHWIAGLVLTASVLYHVVHVFGWQDFWAMWVSPSEVPEGIEELKHALGAGSAEPPKAGKYAFDHKLYHHMAAAAGLAAAATGLFMMVRIDTPLWSRNPYLLSDSVWGGVYVVHGLAGVALIGLVVAHIYFALRPEKRWITWSMINGWISRDRYLAHFDSAKWVVKGDPTARVTGGAVADAAAQARREDA